MELIIGILALLTVMFAVLFVWQMRSGRVVAAKLVELEVELAKSNERVVSLTAENDKMKSDISQLRQENGRLALAEQKLAVAESEKISLASQLQEKSEFLAQCEERFGVLSAELHDLKVEKAKLDEAVRITKEESATLREQAELQFKEIAEKIFKDKNVSNEIRLKEILDPLKEQITGFKKSIDEQNIEGAKQRGSLMEQLNQIRDLNSALSSDAKELTRALRGNSKVQGDWGEMILKQILDRSGLTSGEEYVEQATQNFDGTPIKNDEGRQLRPDVLLRVPGGKQLIIDSKVSLTAFTDYINASTDEERNHHLSLHIASVRAHINELHQKDYPKYVKDSGGFVMMFIPNEGAYNVALKNSPGLWQEAVDKHVMLINPTNLITTLQLVVRIWDQDRQTRNTLDIARRAGDLYDKFVGFLTDMDKIEKAINSVSSSFNDAKKKLHTGTGNLVKRVSDLRKLGVTPSKKLPASYVDYDDEDIDEDSRKPLERPKTD